MYFSLRLLCSHEHRVRRSDPRDREHDCFESCAFPQVIVITCVSTEQPLEIVGGECALFPLTLVCAGTANLRDLSVSCLRLTGCSKL